MSCSLKFMFIFKNLSQVLTSLYFKHSNNSVRNVAFALTDVTPNHTYIKQQTPGNSNKFDIQRTVHRDIFL